MTEAIKKLQDEIEELRSSIVDLESDLKSRNNDLRLHKNELWALEGEHISEIARSIVTPGAIYIMSNGWIFEVASVKGNTVDSRSFGSTEEKYRTTRLEYFRDEVSKFDNRSQALERIKGVKTQFEKDVLKKLEKIKRFNELIDDFENVRVVTRGDFE